MFSLTPLPGGLATLIYVPVLRQYGGLRGLLSVLVEAFQAVSQYKGSDGIRVARKASKA